MYCSSACKQRAWRNSRVTDSADSRVTDSADSRVTDSADSRVTDSGLELDLGIEPPEIEAELAPALLPLGTICATPRCNYEARAADGESPALADVPFCTFCQAGVFPR